MTRQAASRQRLDARALERLLRPRSVAVIGASPTPGALGASVLANLERFGFKGDLHLVNPKYDRIGERACVQSVSDLPQGIDVAVLAIPRAAVIETTRALAARHTGAAIIFSAGFAESGPTGLADQRELSSIATQNALVIEGPNCLGLVNYVDGIALTFVETSPMTLGSRPGIGIVSQSGALAAVLSTTLMSRDLGISYSISTGNEAASALEDYLGYLLDDAHTKVIALIVEQFRQPRRFLDLAHRARAQGKPIVLLHPGHSQAARVSAATHTGAMAGDYSIMRTQVQRQGVLIADDLQEFADVIELILRCGALSSRGPAILTESGAFKALTLDLCERIGLELPVVDDASAPLLRAALPDLVPVSNPADLTAQALSDPDLYRRCLTAVTQDDRFGSVMFCIIQTDSQTCARKFPSIISAIEQLETRKPVMVAGLDEGAPVPGEYIARLRALNVPYFPTPERAYRAVARLRLAAERGAMNGAEVATVQLAGPLPARGVIAEYRSKQLLAPLGIPFPAGCLVKTREEAQFVAAKIGGPVVLKAQSADLPHKSDAGGVILGLQDMGAVAQGWDELQANIARARPGLSLDGVLIEKMSSPGVELIIGGRNDPDWGPVVLVGFGGMQAEILQDVRLLAADLAEEAIVRELNCLRGSAVLHGFRGSPAADITAIAHIVRLVGGILRAEPAIREIDLNPVIAYAQGEGAIALDALVVIG